MDAWMTHSILSSPEDDVQELVKESISVYIYIYTFTQIPHFVKDLMLHLPQNTYFSPLALSHRKKEVLERVGHASLFRVAGCRALREYATSCAWGLGLNRGRGSDNS